MDKKDFSDIPSPAKLSLKIQKKYTSSQGYILQKISNEVKMDLKNCQLFVDGKPVR